MPCKYRKPIEPLPENARQRFHDLVQRANPDECWQWLGWQHPITGYGSFRTGRRSFRAHRVAFYLATGIDPKQPYQDVLHTCDNPICCNPAHLFTGTHADNMRDRRNKGRAASTKGILNGRAKLTEDDIRTIRLEYRPNTRDNVRDLAIKFGVSRRQIHGITRGEKWIHVTP